MATKGLQRLVRRAVLARLKARPQLTALVPAARIHAQEPGPEPAWPFIKTGEARTIRSRGTGFDGGTVTLDVHAFASARLSGGTVAETGEDHCGRIGAEIETALNDAWIALEDGSTAKIRLSDIALMQDETAGDFHYVAQVNARVLAATGV